MGFTDRDSKRLARDLELLKVATQNRDSKALPVFYSVLERLASYATDKEIASIESEKLNSMIFDLVYALWYSV